MVVLNKWPRESLLLLLLLLAGSLEHLHYTRSKVDDRMHAWDPAFTRSKVDDRMHAGDQGHNTTVMRYAHDHTPCHSRGRVHFVAKFGLLNSFQQVNQT